MTAMTNRPDPMQPLNDEARALARSLLAQARHGALAWTDPVTGTPGISRIALGSDIAGCPMTLVSGLAAHTPALKAHPDCALMVGEPGAKGDPLTHPRLMIRARAAPVAPDDPTLGALRSRWLAHNPKAGIYIDLPDFRFVRLVPQSALLNAGFGRASRLGADDLLGQ